MADMTITSEGPREFEVRVRGGDGETSHRVTVPEYLIQELGVSEEDLESLVRESFEFLLEREPASSILPEFSLRVISDYFPEYPQEMSRRFS